MALSKVSQNLDNRALSGPLLRSSYALEAHDVRDHGWPYLARCV